MKIKYIILISLISLVLSCKSPSTIPPEEAQNAIELTLNGAEPLPGGKVHLHSKSTNLSFDASVENKIPDIFDAEIVEERFRWEATDGTFAAISGIDTMWDPPEKSALVTITVKYTCVIQQAPSGFKKYDPLTVNVSASSLVMSATPVSELKNGMIDNYTVGEYPDPSDKSLEKRFGNISQWPKKHPEAYRRPEGFFKITENDLNIHLSRTFTLGDYTMHYPWFTLGMPQYIAVDKNLFRKLEALIDLMKKDGYKDADKIAVIYPFRPPHYNLGMIEEDGASTLKVPFSMHQYGKAMDMIIDVDDDLILDDLNGDGKHDVYDALVIAHYVNILDRLYRDEGDPRMGGAGVYTHHDFHERKPSPYIHIDVRGFTNDQGHLIRWPSQHPDGKTIQWGKI